jgi:hypothetical protein
MTQQPDVYALLGHKEMELAQKQVAVDAAFALIRQLKDGKISLDDIEVTSTGLKAVLPMDTPELTKSENGASPAEQTQAKVLE